MKQQRPKQPEWGKPLRFIERREDFLKIEAGEGQAAAPVERKKEHKEAAKQDIVVSKYELITRVNRISSEAGIPLNYIRITNRLNLPKVDRYELSEVDYIFLHSNENKYLYGGRKCLTVDLLERAIVELELMTGKESTVIPKTNEPKLKALFEREYDYVLKLDNCDEFVRLVYNHWRSRREELKAPLLRVLWKPNPDDNSHYLAFRPREKEDKEKKKQLRRQNKPTEEETISNMNQLQREFREALTIVERVRMRQNLRLQMMTLDLKQFNVEAKAVKEEGLFDPEFNRIDLARNKEEIARMTKQYETKKLEDEPEEKIEEEMVEDPKTAIVNFLASLVSKNSKLTVDFDTILGGGTRPPLIMTSSNSQLFPSTSSTKNESTIVKARDEPSNICRFSLSRFQLSPYEMFLERSFNEDNHFRTEETEEAKGIDNFFVEKHKRVRSGYFFEDDEDDYKDVRKNISLSFKKWKGQTVLKV